MSFLRLRLARSIRCHGGVADWVWRGEWFWQRLGGFRGFDFCFAHNLRLRERDGAEFVNFVLHLRDTRSWSACAREVLSCHVL